MLTNLRVRLAVAFVVLAATTLSCSDSTASDSTVPEVHPGFQIIELPRTTQHDTVRTVIPGTLVVALEDSVGRPRVGTEVSILAIWPNGTPTFSDLLLLRDAVDSSHAWSKFGVQLLTDYQGIVRARVKLGDVAGELGLLIAAQSPSGLVTDTLHFLVNPGSPVSIDLQPNDSTLYTGGSYSLRARVFDALGNERYDEVTTSTDSTAITITTDGLVAAQHIGRALVRGTVADVVDSAWVSVVPHGILVASRSHTGSHPDQLLQFELDGSDLTVLDGRSIEQPSFSPSGTRMVFVDRSESAYFDKGRVFVRESDGGEHPLISDYVDYQEAQQSPRFSADEQWVYYSGGTGHWGIWRVHPDGTGSELVADPPNDGSIIYGYSSDPAPSPDGRYVAYVPWLPCCDLLGLRILDLDSRDTVVGPYAYHMRWIPGTDSLVVSTVDGYNESTGFAIVTLDGTVVRRIADPLRGESPFDISPDGHWIAVSSNDPSNGVRRIHLINLDTGTRLPLGFSNDMGSVAWHP